MAYTSKDDQTCFHCGLKGHPIASCPALLAGEEQNQAGKDAKLAFHVARKNWRKAHGKKKGPKSKIHNYLAVKKYFHSLYEGGKNFTDPLKLLDENPDDSVSQNRLQKAAREFFDAIVDAIHKDVIAVFEGMDDSGTNYIDIKERSYRKRNDNNPWVQVLNQAVKDGIPADFSDTDNNRYYTVHKLEGRTRYLHHLVWDDNDICNEVRNVLVKCLNAQSDLKERRSNGTVKICSIGGGPGYDHLAIWIALLFIYNMNGPMMDKKVSIETDVFDLFGEWEEIIEVMNRSMSNVINDLSDAKSDFDVEIFKADGAKMKLCDIRERLDCPVNIDLSNSITSVDIICFSFVIHENASSILSEDQGDPLIRGATRDIMERAPIGTLMICLDSNNFCWSSLKATAKAFGWRVFGALERGSRIKMGPKEFVVFRRVHHE